jgi:hypothetical protein
MLLPYILNLAFNAVRFSYFLKYVIRFLVISMQVLVSQCLALLQDLPEKPHLVHFSKCASSCMVIVSPSTVFDTHLRTVF